MAPNRKTVEQQTSEIIRYLVEDDFPVFECSEVEADGPPGEGSFFSRYLQVSLAGVFLHTIGQTLLCFIIHVCFYMFQMNLMLGR